MMGWRPWEVRRATLPDFNDAFDGFLLMNGQDPDGPDTSDAAVKELEDLMEMYPDD